MSAIARRLAAAALAVVLLGIGASSAAAADEFEKYALKSVSTSLSDAQAGAHADFTTTFILTHTEIGDPNPYAFTRDLEVALPPGLTGNPQNIPTCTVVQLGGTPEESACPFESQVGVSEVVLGTAGGHGGSFLEPIYNMPSPGGDVVARLGFIAGAAPLFINVRVDPRDYSLVASIEDASAAAALIEATTTLWGVPAAENHDDQRLTPLEAPNGPPPGGRDLETPEAPFLSNPTDCSLARQVTFTARSYQLPGAPSTLSAPLPKITGCGKLDFKPTFATAVTNPEASAPTGLDATLTIPQEEIWQGLATSTLRSAAVTLPEGLTINPAAADGLAACSPEQVGFGASRPSNCPDAAKIGAVELDVPALEHVLRGSVYQRTPEDKDLFRFWVVTDEQGVHLKLPAEIEPDQQTGRLTTVFLGIPTLGGNPQLPFSELRLHIFGGPRAPLSTPGSCGVHQTHFQFSPWSGKPPVEGDTPIQISTGCGKGGFSPGLTAGTESLRAGSFSPFVFTLTRSDGEANPRAIALHLSQGLLAKLGGVPLCPDAQAASGGCPAASKVGSVSVSTGVGGAPLWVPQPGKAPTAAFLAGPYRGAPYSIVSVVPAQAGPFDLGTVVNRSAIRIDPETALATIATDPLPQILEGVPVTYRTLHVEVDRKDFTLNPTSCAPKKITATVTAANGATAEPSTGFQATNCAKLGYKPKLALSFAGQTKRTGNPAIKATLRQNPHQANNKAASVVLPVGLFIDNAHINNPCTRVQFDASKCPKTSVLGTAKAVTPLLSQPLTGKVYFRSNGGDRELPDIVADLHGAVHITLVGYIDSVQKKGTESSRVRTRFLHIPDAPVTKFTMNLFGGEKGLIENSVNLCSAPRRAQVELKAQNGRSRSSRAAIATRCGKR
jgi:hypothetical protein